jgi:tRNA (cmo5U34)-methyltransferase
MDVCRHRVQGEGFAERCDFHEGYLDSLPVRDLYESATCFLVSQFILEPDARSEFFRAIADRLRQGGILASSDLASGAGTGDYEALLPVWLNVMAGAGIPPEGLERMRAAYAKDVAILPPQRIAAIIESGGFGAPVQFFQAGLIHAWFSRRTSGDDG